jgi:hypothetical protein
VVLATSAKTEVKSGASLTLSGAVSGHDSNLTIDAKDATTLNDLTVGGNLSMEVTGKTILSGASVGGDLSMEVVGETSFAALVAGDLSITSSSQTSLGTAVVGGVLSVSSGGDVSQTGSLKVTGRTTVAAAGQGVRLDDSGNAFNDTVEIKAGSVTLNGRSTIRAQIESAGDLLVGSANALDVEVDAGGRVSLSADGDLSAAIARAQSIDVESGASVTLNTDQALSGQMRAAGDIRVAAAQDLQLSVSASGDLELRSGGAIRQLDESGARLAAGGQISLQAERGIGDQVARLVVDSASLTATTNDGGVWLESDSSIMVDGELSAKGGDSRIVVLTRGDFSMAPEARVLSAAGPIELRAGGDVLLSEVATESSADLRVEAEGAIIGSGASRAQAHLRTAGAVTLRAVSGIGGFDSAVLRIDAARVSAVNTGDGHVVIAGFSGLTAAGEGIVNRSPQGWVALLSESGRIESGQVQAASGRLLTLTGKVSITEQEANASLALFSSPDLLGAPSTLPGVPAALQPSVVPSASRLDGSLLSQGLDAVRQGLLLSTGQVSVTEVMNARDPGVAITASALVSQQQREPDVVAVSGVLRSVSATPTVSESSTASSALPSLRQTAPASSVPSDSRPTPAAQPGVVSPQGSQPAPDSAPAPDAPGAAGAVQGSGTPASGSPAGVAPGAAPSETSPAQSGPAGEGDRAPVPDAGSGTAIPNAGEERSDADSLILQTGFGSRLSSAYQGFAQRLAKWFDRGADARADLAQPGLTGQAQPDAQPVAPAEGGASVPTASNDAHTPPPPA